MRGKKFSSPRDTNNSDAIAIKNVIQEIAQEEIKRFGFPTYKAAIVRKINEDGTVDCYLPPNEDNLVTGVLNKCGELLFVGDSVELETKNGSLTNCWVAIKHGTNVQGQAEEVENLSGEVVMKVQNGRLSVTELNRDAVLGNAFTIIAEDINLDGMNIVLNGSRGITITSPYFNVTSQGYITATGGKIGGWEMGATRLYSGSGANYVALDSGTSGIDYPIWAGNETASSAPFRVTRAGALTSTSGSIGGWTIGGSTLSAGNITLNSNGSISGGSTYGWSISTNGYATFNGATISGNITATSGKIADYTINGAMLVGNNVGLSGTSGQGWAFWAGSNDAGSAPFRVGHDGSFYASSGSISGSIIGSGINANNISSGSLSAGYISGGTLSLATSGGGRVRFGAGTTHMVTTGLNLGYNGVNAGIDMNGSGISHCSGTTNTGNMTTGSDAQLDIYGKTMRLRAKDGLGYMVFLKGDATTGFTGLNLYNLVHDSSSKNMKKNIKLISQEEENKLYNLLKEIPLYSFQYKKRYDDPTKLEELHHGFMIEDVENTILDDYLHFKQDDKDKNIKTYDYKELSKLNLVLIKSLQNKIIELEERLNQIIV